jgi:hypothetical protein
MNAPLDPEMMTKLAALKPELEAIDKPAKLDDEALKSIERVNQYTDRRRGELRDKYAWGLAGPLVGERSKVARLAAQEVTDPTERKWLVDEVARIAGLANKVRNQRYNESGYVGRLADVGLDVGESAVEGFGGIGQAAKKWLGQRPRDEDVPFLNALESAKQAEFPTVSREMGLAGKAATGAAGMAPDMAAGTSALLAGGPQAAFGYWAARQFPERREGYVEMGLGPGASSLAGAATSGAEAAIELLNIDPTGLTKPITKPAKGFLRRGMASVAEKIGGKALESIAKHPVARRTVGAGVESIESIGKEALEEGLQGAVETGGKYLAGKATGAEGAPQASDILREAVGQAGAALPGIAVLGGVGGVSKASEAASRFRRFARGTERARIEEEIIRYADDGEVPSRAKWASWGFPVEAGASSVKRAESAKWLAEEFKIADQVRTATSGVTPTETQWKQWGLPAEEGNTPEARKASLQRRILGEPEAVPEVPAEAAELAGEISTTPELSGVHPESVQEELSRAEPQQASQPSEGGASLTVPSWDSGGTQEEAVSPGVSAPSAREEAQRAADVARPARKGFLAEEAAAAPIGGTLGERQRADVVGGVSIAPESEEVSRRLQAAHGVATTSFAQKVKSTLRTAWNYTTRAQEHLATTGENAVANEFFRLTKTVPTMAKDEAIRTVASIVDPLGPEQMKLFERYAVVQNQLAALDLGQPLRFGFESREEVADYKETLEDIIEKTPDVKAAVETRRRVVREIVQNAVARKLLPERALDNVDAYYHQQVHLYQEAQRSYAGGTKPKATKRSFQKRRVTGDTLGEEYDYNTSYVEAETAWMADAMAEIRKDELLEGLMAKYDSYDAMKAQANKDGITVEEVVRKTDGVTFWQPAPGNIFYRAFSVPERIAEQLQSGIIESYDLTKDEVRQVLAVGNLSRRCVIPTELAAQLDAARKSEQPHWLTAMNHKLMSHWKAWTLLNPKRVLAYNIRNKTGDIEPVLAAIPSAMLEIPCASAELWRYAHGNLSLSRELRNARDLGVVSSGFFTSELSELGELNIFKRLKEEGAGRGALSVLLHPARSYMEAVRPFVDFRENLLRYATFRRYLKKLNSGELSHFGASKREVVQQLQGDMGNEVAAAHLARELLGDYGDMTVAGEWVRRNLYPFWAFQEINLKRWPRLAINAIQSGKGRGRTAVVVSAAATMRIGQMYAGLWVFNNLVMPMLTGSDDEDDLPEYDRANPHVLLGRNPDGTVRVFRNVGALGDFLEWFGINEAISLLGKYEAGQVSAGDIASEMAKAPAEKLIGGIRPDVTGGFEVATGQSLFPSPFAPRSVDRGEAAANIFGLADEYKWMKGLALADGNRVRKNYWQRWFVGVVDPRASALNEIYDLRTRFLKSKGAPEQGTFPVSEYKEAREAAINEDYGAFVEWKRAFQKRHPEGGGHKRFVSFLKRLDPIASRLNDRDEKEFELRYLTKEQKVKLRAARDYSAELRDRLVVWWEADARSGVGKRSLSP